MVLQHDYLQEASLLMAKLCYVEGDYREALNQYSRVNLDDLQLVGSPVYRLSMIAEAYATKGKNYKSQQTVQLGHFFTDHTNWLFVLYGLSSSIWRQKKVIHRERFLFFFFFLSFSTSPPFDFVKSIQQWMQTCF